jgi:signal peptidase I
MPSWIRNNRGILIFMLIFGLFRTAVADWNPIPSGSMRPTLLEGDVVFVNRLAFDVKVPLTDVIVTRLGDPHRGDVVTFSSPGDGTRLIKRVMAVPGDTIEMRDKVVIVNGRQATYQPLGIAIEEPARGVQTEALRLDEKSGDRAHVIQWFLQQGKFERDSFGPLVVPADRYVMLGDNRDNSADSRSFGFVPRERLIGRAVAILVSANITGDWAPRFERFGEKLD